MRNGIERKKDDAWFLDAFVSNREISCAFEWISFDGYFFYDAVRWRCMSRSFFFFFLFLSLPLFEHNVMEPPAVFAGPVVWRS